MMPEYEANLGLGYNWDPLTENYADDMDTNIKTIGAIIQLAVESKDVFDPGTLTPQNGQAWIVAPSAQGVWAGKEGQIAAYTGDAWLFAQPREGWTAWIKDEQARALYNGSNWTNNPQGGGSINDGENLGGTGIHAGINADKLTFKGLLAGSGVGISSDATTITLTSTAGAALTPANLQTGLTYTLVASDAGKVIEMQNPAANTLIIPPDSQVNFAVGTTINVTQWGAGVTTIGPGSGVTIRNAHGTLSIRTRYGIATLRKRAANEWHIEGNLAEL